MVGAVTYIPGAAPGVHDHGTGHSDLTADDHTQYLLETLLDAKGDLIVASAADTAARLAKGTDGQYLRVSTGSGSGDIEWASFGTATTPIGPWSHNDILASQATAVRGTWGDATGSGNDARSYTAPYDTTIRALSATLSAARTAGAVRLRIFINGSDQGDANSILINTNVSAATLTGLSVAVVAGDLVDIRYTTDASWAPTTSDARTVIWTDVPVAIPEQSSTAHAVVVKTSTESVAGSTTPQADDELLFAVGANETWTWTALIWYDNAGSATPDILYEWTGPTGSTVRWADNAVTSADALPTVATAYIQRVGGEDAGHGASTTIRPIRVEGSIINGSTAGNLNFNWAQNSSDAGNATRVLTGSYIVAHRV